MKHDIVPRTTFSWMDLLNVNLDETVTLKACQSLQTAHYTSEEYLANNLPPLVVFTTRITLA